MKNRWFVKTGDPVVTVGTYFIIDMVHYNYSEFKKNHGIIITKVTYWTNKKYFRMFIRLTLKKIERIAIIWVTKVASTASG